MGIMKPKCRGEIQPTYVTDAAESQDSGNIEAPISHHHKWNEAVRMASKWILRLETNHLRLLQM